MTIEQYKQTKEYAVNVIALSVIIELGLGRTRQGSDMFHDAVADLARACNLHPLKASAYVIAGVDELIRAED